MLRSQNKPLKNKETPKFYVQYNAREHFDCTWENETTPSFPSLILTLLVDKEILEKSTPTSFRLITLK